jgi:peptidoglycan/LPS O-acetylase OafA/YrhL
MDRVSEADEGVRGARMRQKMLPLEALRGIASICVVVHHFVIAFLPEYIRINPSQTGLTGKWIGMPFYGFMNGYSMVIVFFILSGYVLSLKGLQPEADRILAETAFKRWFRLTPLICFSLLFSYILFQSHYYAFTTAGKLSGSKWLEEEAFSGLTQNSIPAFGEFISDGLYGTLLFNEHRFNGVLWTMSIEFWGSLIVLTLALLLASGRRFWVLPAVLVTLLILFSENSHVFLLSSFVCGFIGVFVKLSSVRLERLYAGCLLAAGIYLCGYFTATGWYSWLVFIPLTEVMARIVVLTVGGCCLVIVFASQNVISARFCGNFSILLGKLSFPIYLIHIPIIASFSSSAYIASAGGNNGVIMAGVVLLVIGLPLAWLLAQVDKWWLKKLAAWRPFNKTNK